MSWEAATTLREEPIFVSSLPLIVVSSDAMMFSRGGGEATSKHQDRGGASPLNRN